MPRSNNIIPQAVLAICCSCLCAAALNAKYDQVQNSRSQLLASAVSNPGNSLPGYVPDPVVPIRLVANTIVISANLNHQGNFSLLFDTGAENSITPHTAQKLGLKVEWGLQGEGFGNARLNVGKTKVPSVQIGGVTLFNQTFYVLSLPYAITHGLKAGLVGILGYQVLRNLPITINYQNSSLTLHDGQSFRYTGDGVALPLLLRQREPMVQGTIDGIAGTFRIDTGSNAPLTLFAPYVADKNLVQRFSAHLQGFAGEGLGGPETAYFARVHTLELGGLKIHELSAQLLQDREGIGAQPEEAGDVGTQVLKRFNVTLDYPHRMIYLEKNARYDEPDVFDRSGLALRIQPQGLVVMSVLSDSPAEQAGIKTGDVVIAVNKQTSREISAAFLLKVFRQSPGIVVHLRVWHNGVERDVSLKLRNIL